MTRVNCRAKIAHNCLDGTPVQQIYGEGVSQSEDGTWDGMSVICDACYITLCPLTPSGHGLSAELDAAISKWKEQRGLLT